MSALPVIAFLIPTPAVERLGWTLMHSLWQLALVPMLALAIARAMRRSGSALRYGVLVGGMVLSTLAPLATWMLLPTPAAQSTQGAASRAGQFDPAGRPSADEMPGAGPGHLAATSTLDPRPGYSVPAALSGYSAADRVSSESSNAQAMPHSLWQRIQAAMRPRLGWIVAVWCFGVILCSSRPLLGWRTLGRLRRVETSPASDEVLTAAGRMSRRLGLRRTVRVLNSTLAQVPVVVGYLRPVVLLPVSLVTNIPPRQLQAILAHELAHVQRHDFLVNLLQTLVETLFFYHPGMWLLSRRIRIEREHCCDDLAVNLIGNNRVEYGRALLAIEELRGQAGVLALGAGGGSLLSRVRRLACVEPDRKVASLADRLPAALLCLAVIGVTCVIHRAWAEPKPSPVDHGKPVTQAAGERTREAGVPVLSKIRGLDRLFTNQSMAGDEQGAADSKAPVDPNDVPPPSEIAANGEIIGRLTDVATGKPVEGATIACGALLNDSAKAGGTNAVTDGEGRYRLLVPSPGIYVVWLKAFDQEPSKTAAADDGIRVEAGKVSASQLRLVSGRKVAGKIVDATGKTYADMKVYCYSPARPASGGPQSTRTGADGTFEFALPPGRAHIYAIEQDKEHPDVPFAVSRSAEADIKVPADGEIAPLTLTLVATQSKFGDDAWLKRSTPGTQIVRHEGNKDVTGTVVDEGGKPIAGAKVFQEDGTPVVSDDKGEFHLVTMKGAQFIMHAVAPGYHAWFGTPTAGDVLKVVLEPKELAAAGHAALPEAQEVASRKFALRFKLASESADDLRQILLGRPGHEAKPSSDNQEITVTAPPEAVDRVRTFITVTDWPDGIARGSNFEYPRDSVTRAARSFFYACAIQDSDEVFSKLLSVFVLAQLKGDTKSEKYENYIIGGAPDRAWEEQLRGDWPGKKEAIQRMVREWNRYPLKRLTETGGVAIGFGVKHFCSVSFDGAPKDFYEVAIEPDRTASRPDKEAFCFSSLPPWWEAKPADAAPPRSDAADHALQSGAIPREEKNIPPAADPKQAAADEASFRDAAKLDAERHRVEFFVPPTAGALRHLGRLEGVWDVNVQWPGSMDESAAAVFKGVHVKSVKSIELAEPDRIDAWLKQLAAPDTGFKSLRSLDLYRTPTSDAGLKELARRDSGLTALVTLHLNGTKITDAGLKELARPDTAVKSLTFLDLIRTQLTDAGLKELAQPDSGLKSLASLDLYGTKVTDAGIKELAQADSSLKQLAFLRLGSTPVTDASLKEISRQDTGLKSLASLDLSDTKVTDAGLNELARPDTGIKSLKVLSIWQTQITDTGLNELAGPHCGLKKLESLYLHQTKATDAGIDALQRARPGMRIER